MRELGKITKYTIKQFWVWLAVMNNDSAMTDQYGFCVCFCDTYYVMVAHHRYSQYYLGNSDNMLHVFSLSA